MITLNIERREVVVKLEGKKAKDAKEAVLGPKPSGQTPGLTPKEFGLLQILAKANGRVVTRETILNKVWGHDHDVNIDTRTVDQHVARLRIKLRRVRPDASRCVITATNVGYKTEGVAIIGDHADPDMLGKVVGIKREFGGKPGADVTVRVGSVVPKLKLGDAAKLVPLA